MKSSPLRLLIPGLVPFLIATTVAAGGWAVVTFGELPEYVVSGTPLRVTFMVRQHGVTLLDGLHASVRATAAEGEETTVVATPTARRGEYSATLTLPRAGEWTVGVVSGFWGVATYTVATVNVLQPGTSPPPALSQPARGERLFVAKGCVGCHRHQDVAAPTLVSIAPDLSGRRFQPAYLRDFLADPAKSLKRSASPQYGQMPNLNLQQQEIEALAAFINRDSTGG